MDLRLVLAEVLFLLESFVAFFAFEWFFKFFNEALSALFWRINYPVLLVGINHDTEHRTFLFIYFEYDDTGNSHREGDMTFASREF
jgi:hypothetical protein